MAEREARLSYREDQSESFYQPSQVESASKRISPMKHSVMSITQSQFLAFQDQQRAKLGLPTLSQLPGYNQDRLIASIAIIKEVLLSNMQLREDLLNLS